MIKNYIEELRISGDGSFARFSRMSEGVDEGV